MSTTPGTPKTAKATAAPKELTAEEKAKRMSEARNAAQSTLNERHRKELNDLITAEAKNRGIDWKPKPTEAEKKRAALLELLQDNDLLQVAREVAEAQSTPATPVA